MGLPVRPPSRGGSVWARPLATITCRSSATSPAQQNDTTSKIRFLGVHRTRMFTFLQSDLIGQYSAINLMGDLMDDQSLIVDGKTVIEMISDQVPKMIGDQFDWPSNVHR